jgi:uncharacterized protein
LRKSSLLWSVISPAGEQSWIFGTMHIRDDRVYRFCESLYPIIRQANVYVGEMDLDSGLPAMEQGPDYNMRAYFRPPIYQKIRHQLEKSFSLDVSRYDHLHPLMIMSAISQHFLQHDHMVSMDEHLWDYAKSNHLEVRGLESVEEQMALLHEIPPEPLYVQIRAISKYPSKFRKFADRTLVCYLENKLHLLYSMTKASMHQLRKKLIYERNRKMVERIKAFPTNRSYFITVGAGHLSGSSGIISLLRKAGYKMAAVNFTRPNDTSQPDINVVLKP